MSPNVDTFVILLLVGDFNIYCVNLDILSTEKVMAFVVTLFDQVDSP